MKIAVHRKSLVLAAIALSGCASAALSATLPAAANAYAAIAPPPVPSTAVGLPDGRVYEQVSPADKNGNQAGASTNPSYESSHYALAAADGNSVLFEGTGGFGETLAGYNLYYVAQRSAGGWSTRGILPRAQQSTTELGGQLELEPKYVDPSADLSHVMFLANRGTFTPGPGPECGTNVIPQGQLYLSGPEPALTTAWLDQPEIPNPIQVCVAGGIPVGGTPDFRTVYFTFPGTLLPEDASRAPHTSTEGILSEAWGFYEDREGALREAGVLPDGSLSPFGAVPAASGRSRAPTGNQVSADGSRAFFVSPDPASCVGQRGKNNCAADPPELYVRENGEKTLLVSQDTLLPEVGGLPASAPSGVSPMLNPTIPVVPGSEDS